MKFLISFILIGVLSFAAGTWFPWWSIAIAAFIVAVFIPQSAISAFFAGFLSTGLLWLGMSYFISKNNDHLLANKVSLLIFHLSNPLILIIVTGLIGGLISGLAALSGSLFRPSIRLKSKH